PLASTNTTTVPHTTDVQLSETNSPSSTMDKTALLAQAIEDGAAERTVFYITLALCLLQLLLVLGIQFARSCACKSTKDVSKTSQTDESPNPVAEEPKSARTMRTAREMRDQSSKIR
ncbi:hypothetical protein PMAYCL1PPCAC_01715, partial [Pristionchus mayeri]